MKTIVERLREQDGECLHLIQAVGGECSEVSDCDSCRKTLAERIADEIERCYIPRPRFEDGEPVQGGEEFDGGYANYVVISLHHTDLYWIFDDYAGDLTDIPLERPTHKVYDADGVEIKVGDSVWSIADPDHEPLKVKELAENNKFKAEGSRDTVYFIAKSFTHERPIFDAEGVRICKGDTVYDVAGINPEPMRVLSYGNALVLVISKSGIEKNYEFNELTHREPDSLEKLRDDVFSLMIENEFKATAYEIKDRFTVLIERGA